MAVKKRQTKNRRRRGGGEAAEALKLAEDAVAPAPATEGMSEPVVPVNAESVVAEAADAESEAVNAEAVDA